MIHHAVTVEQPRAPLRHVVGRRGARLGRERMTDADWVSLGAAPDDANYYTRFEELFGLDIRPSE